MSVYLHVTLEIHAAGLARFLEAMEKIAVPFLEGEGWRLSGAFVQRIAFASHSIFFPALCATQPRSTASASAPE